MRCVPQTSRPTRCTTSKLTAPARCWAIRSSSRRWQPHTATGESPCALGAVKTNLGHIWKRPRGRRFHQGRTGRRATTPFRPICISPDGTRRSTRHRPASSFPPRTTPWPTDGGPCDLRGRGVVVRSGRHECACGAGAGPGTGCRVRRRRSPAVTTLVVSGKTPERTVVVGCHAGGLDGRRRGSSAVGRRRAHAAPSPGPARDGRHGLRRRPRAGGRRAAGVGRGPARRRGGGPARRPGWAWHGVRVFRSGLPVGRDGPPTTHR